MGIITPIFQSFSALPEHQATWYTWASQTTPWFKALIISGRISSQSAAFCVLIDRRKTSAAVMVFPQKEPRMSDGVMVTAFKKIFEILSPYPRMSLSLLSKTPVWFLRTEEQHEIFYTEWPEGLLEIEIQSCPKFFQDCILDFFTVKAEDFRTSAYGECKEESALFWSHAFQHYAVCGRKRDQKHRPPYPKQSDRATRSHPFQM